MKHIFFLFIVFPTFLLAQSVVPLDTEIDSIFTSEDALTFIKSNKNYKGKLLTFNKEKHKTTLASELFELSKGGKKSFKTSTNTTHYKVIEKNEVPHYRVSVILLDTDKRAPSELKKLRATLVQAYQTGNRKFEDLAKVYSSGRSSKTGGDLGWLKKGERSEAFENAVNAHAKGDVFLFDDPKGSKKYIVLKTEDWTPIEELTILKVSDPIR